MVRPGFESHLRRCNRRIERIIMDAFAMLKAIGDATAAVSKEITQHEALKNSPEMQKALVIHRMQELLDEQKTKINDEDLEAARRLVAAPDAGAV